MEWKKKPKKQKRKYSSSSLVILQQYYKTKRKKIPVCSSKYLLYLLYIDHLLLLLLILTLVAKCFSTIYKELPSSTKSSRSFLRYSAFIRSISSCFCVSSTTLRCNLCSSLIVYSLSLCNILAVLPAQKNDSNFYPVPGLNCVLVIIPL